MPPVNEEASEPGLPNSPVNSYGVSRRYESKNGRQSDIDVTPIRESHRERQRKRQRICKSLQEITQQS